MLRTPRSLKIQATAPLPAVGAATSSSGKGALLHCSRGEGAERKAARIIVWFMAKVRFPSFSGVIRGNGGNDEIRIAGARARRGGVRASRQHRAARPERADDREGGERQRARHERLRDRKSTRLNSSHVALSRM